MTHHAPRAPVETALHVFLCDAVSQSGMLTAAVRISHPALTQCNRLGNLERSYSCLVRSLGGVRDCRETEIF